MSEGKRYEVVLWNEDTNAWCITDHGRNGAVVELPTKKMGASKRYCAKIAAQLNDGTLELEVV